MSHADYCAQFVTPPDALLDVGSGRGVFLCDMAAKGFRASGIETNPAYIALAKEEAANRGVVISCVEGKAESLPYAADSFDFVNCAEVTEHVHDPRQTCREIFRVLKGEGVAYVSFHNRFGIYDYHYRLWGINWLPRPWTEPVLRWIGKNKSDGVSGRQKLVTMHYYTFLGARRMLRLIGFEVTDIRLLKLRQRGGLVWSIAAVLYCVLLRPFYFNTFHLLLKKRT